MRHGKGMHRMEGLYDWVGLWLVGVGALDCVPPPLHADLHQLLLSNIVGYLGQLHIEGSQRNQRRPQLLSEISSMGHLGVTLTSSKFNMAADCNLVISVAIPEC